MPYSSYSIQGTSCESNTIACTSNHKFLPLKAQIYMKQHTYMMQYPGNGNSPSFANILSKTEHKHPEIIKSYYGKIYENDPDQLNTTPSFQMGKQCKNC
jgi:hypothetical protein